MSWLQYVANSIGITLLCIPPAAMTNGSAVEQFGQFVGALLCLWLIPRALRMGVILDNDNCTIRNLLRTRRLGLHEVERFVFGKAW